MICAGMDTRRFARDLGMKSVLMPVKGYSFTAPAGDGALKVSITDVARKIVLCPLRNEIRVAGICRDRELGQPD